MDKALDKLLDKIKDGNEQAFVELYELYYKRVYYFALQICKNSHDAQDITQDTFMQLQKSLPSLKENQAFSVWLHRIIISKAGLLFRKHKEIGLPDDHITFKTSTENRDYMLPSDSMHFESDKDVLTFLITQLDEKYRIVLTLSYFSNFKIKEIAKILDVPEGTVKSRMSTAKELLKQKVIAYQEREGVQLDFKSLDMAGALSAFFVPGAINKISKLSLSPFKKGMTFFSKSVGMQIVGTCAIVATGAIVSVGAYQVVQEYNKSTISNPTLVNNSNKKISFPSVEYRGKFYENPEDALYELLFWAHCEVEMGEYTSQEIEEIKVLYDALKEEDGVYWKELERMKWNQKFESFLK